jgi:uncharacterized protein (DUF2267 family)
MQENDLLQHVQKHGGHDTVDAARESAHAVLRSLGATLDDEEATDLAAQLPEGFASDLSHAETADDRSPEAFIDRIEGSSATDLDAEAEATAVCSSVAAGVTDGELSDVLDGLPAGYDEFVQPKHEPDI